MDKVKTEVIEEQETENKPKIQYNMIVNPMAPEGLIMKCYKLLSQASKYKTFLRYGLRDVQKRIRKGETGILVLAGDIPRMDLISHLPLICEDKNIPYCYLPRKKDIGAAMGKIRDSLMVLIREHEDYKDLYDECKEEIENLHKDI